MTDLGCTVDVRTFSPGRARLWRFIGPASLISVGYMDPGNWATDLEGGARFGYQLLWVLVAANLIAMLLQTLAARLGIVGGRDLAQACRDRYSTPVARSLWVLCEIAIIACDLAEVLGGAMALNLLFSIPLAWGALITGLDVMLVLMLQHHGIRKLESVIAALVLTIGCCMALMVFLSGPNWSEVASGLTPHLNGANLYVAIGILGATVMPHNLYLHSSLVSTRRIDVGVAAKREALRYNLIDTVLSLNIAFLINAAILVVAAATFFTRQIEVTELRQAHDLLSPLLGSAAASVAFAIALLASGQSSSITGTLAGQIVMEGFMRFRISPLKRRLLTRSIAIVPAVAVLAVMGEGGMLRLLVLSQVVLSLQLPFAIVPLIRFTSDPETMGVFVTVRWVKRVVQVLAAAITGLNGWLIWKTFNGAGDALTDGSGWQLAAGIGIGVGAAAGAALLVWIAVVPLRRPEDGATIREASTLA